ncbi:MAG TPA: bifunctional UDP-N-acetylglucosamine diphosphorylase/glucosamine-1-phosphate N-acetyltransferase GlmU [Anaerolineaceae bacterium]|jgi:bifunctional UDP-N-acetylglucosamine pyrophosphorylase/glucosamine-1-phosphate N-acetyltransferase|nr:bifunctional UDP-N-acetylglucosamine diphosphorylase/glucosamine-1-phosphate N-acetyltransferase GlmU [Anaerolineaceae bacterium]NMD27260.1 bifunctional UDP-N-acetylglucosamine diphosphorylase/glucosamine-1-phosphate N-acetyltransferase GlmU [Chloroflexota bacterium]HOA22258.1 bifunctional UDP-N-acetylglucosamine diphosphorylase/glucosamine-1-phosphate N-acetyltransferase GlmU [Anaerolineaceae bacterium]HOG77043.1 bifunctional UDP-N-acetylglucosamine diphosphorylase/glucosamine-1-phosphate N-
MKTASIILAAGQGTRMRSRLPKVLHPILSKPMVLYALEAARAVSDYAPVLVVGHAAEVVRSAVEAADGSALFALQEQQLGTGHAVMSARAAVPAEADLVLVTCGDMPLLRAETLRQLVSAHQQSGGVITMTSVVGEVPRGFGRIVRGADGSVRAIIEEADATPEQLALQEYNVSAYCFDANWLWGHLEKIQLSAKKEYYLTDLVAMAAAEGRRIEALVLQDRLETLGINTRVDLADAESAMRRRVNEQWMLAGVTLLDPATTTIETDVRIGQDTVIFPNTALRGNTLIGEDCRIGPNTSLLHTQVGNETTICDSVAEYASVGSQVSIGPFCHLRKGAVLADRVHMGNFGEVKSSRLGENVKMGHFSYIGDAVIGANVNIGAGTITCNFDGVHKNVTEIGENSFIGSDTMLVAPLKIGKNARTGAGSVVTRDVPDDALVYGVPARERKEQSGQ